MLWKLTNCLIGTQNSQVNHLNIKYENFLRLNQIEPKNQDKY